MAEAHLTVALWSFTLLFAMLVCCEAGYRSGRRAFERSPSAHKGVGTIEAAIFGLFGLLLGFSFAAGITNVQTRRHLIVEEANAIGTAYLRLDLLAADAQPEMRRLFREYLEARLSAYEKVPDVRATSQEFARAAEVGQRIWRAAMRAAGTSSNPAPMVLLVPALNSMLDVAASRKVALYTHLPGLILALLVSIAVLSAFLAGYTLAERGERSWPHMVVYALVTTITIYAVYDLDHPRGGLIRLQAADAALTELRNSIR